MHQWRRPRRRERKMCNKQSIHRHFATFKSANSLRSVTFIHSMGNQRYNVSQQIREKKKQHFIVFINTMSISSLFIIEFVFDYLYALDKITCTQKHQQTHCTHIHFVRIANAINDNMEPCDSWIYRSLVAGATHIITSLFLLLTIHTRFVYSNIWWERKTKKKPTNFDWSDS